MKDSVPISKVSDEMSASAELSPQTAGRQIVVAGLIIVVCFFGFGGAWAYFSDIHGAVIAPGEVRIDTERKTVQHLEGGIVRRILVRNGDQVEAGQVLLILDSVQVDSNSEQLLLQLVAAELEEARLIAERDLTLHPAWPLADKRIDERTYGDLQQSAARQFAIGRTTLQHQMELFRAQIRQLNEQLSSIEERLVTEQVVEQTLQEELDAKMVLFMDNFIDKTRILELQRAVAERRSIQAQLRGTRAEKNEQKVELEFRIRTHESEYTQTAMNRLAEVQQNVFALRQKLLAVEDVRQRMEVRAPVSGVVVAMQVHSEGGVIQQAQPLLDIVPYHHPLIVEADIAVADIADIAVGQLVDVQLMAFSARTTPKISGQIVYVSADRLFKRTPYGEMPVYQIQVELDRQELSDHQLHLTAGMPTTLFIRTRPRTVFDYAIEPLMENFDRALREK